MARSLILILCLCAMTATTFGQSGGATQPPSMQETMQKLMAVYGQNANNGGGSAGGQDTNALLSTYAQMLQGAGAGAGGAQGGEEMQKMMATMMGGTKPNDPSTPGKPLKPDSASMMMPLLMMPLVMGMGGGQGAERRAWAQPPRWWFQPPWWWNQPPWWFNQEP